MNALTHIRAAGFEASLTDDGRLAISPAHQLTQTQRDFLKANKAEIVDELRAEMSGLSAVDRQLLNRYLDHIEEFDLEMRDDILTECERNPEALVWAIAWANRTLDGTAQPTKLELSPNCEPLSTIVRTPAGNEIIVMARDANHIQFLLQFNP